MAKALIKILINADVRDALERAKLEAEGPQGDCCMVQVKESTGVNQSSGCRDGSECRFRKPSCRSQNLL